MAEDRSVLGQASRLARRYDLTPDEEQNHDKFQDLRKRMELVEAENDRLKARVDAMAALLAKNNIR